MDGSDESGPSSLSSPDLCLRWHGPTTLMVTMTNVCHVRVHMFTHMVGVYVPVVAKKLVYIVIALPHPESHRRV